MNIEKIYVYVWGNCFGLNCLLIWEINKYSDILIIVYNYSWLNYDFKFLCYLFMYIKWDYRGNV